MAAAHALAPSAQRASQVVMVCVAGSADQSGRMLQTLACCPGERRRSGGVGEDSGGAVGPALRGEGALRRRGRAGAGDLHGTRRERCEPRSAIGALGVRRWYRHRGQSPTPLEARPGPWCVARVGPRTHPPPGTRLLTVPQRCLTFRGDGGADGFRKGQGPFRRARPCVAEVAPRRGQVGDPSAHVEGA